MSQQPVPGPGAAEYQQRLERVRTAMAERSMAALVITDPANMYYLTGYNAWSFYTPQCVVIPASGDPVLFARAMDADGARYTTYLPESQIEGYPENLVHRPDVHPYDWMATRIRERGLLPEDDAVVGVEGDSNFFTARGYLALQAGLPNARLVDSRELVNWVRVVKSDFEISQMRIAGTISQHAMEVALDAIRVGRRQCDAVAEILAAQAGGTAENGGDYTAIVPMLPTGEAAGAPHLTWTDEPFRAAEATTIEIAGAYRRYHCPIARTISLGPPADRLASTAAVVRDGMAGVLDTMRAGVTAGDVHAVWDEIIRARGLSKASRIGYSIGIGYPPDWGERTISLRPGEGVQLEAGMCFHVILGMWMDGWGYELSEPLAVTATGVERFTDLTQDLTIRQETA